MARLEKAHALIWETRQLLPYGMSNQLSDLADTPETMARMQLAALMLAGRVNKHGAQENFSRDRAMQTVALGSARCGDVANLVYHKADSFDCPLNFVLFKSVKPQHTAVVAGQVTEVNGVRKLVNPAECVVIDPWPLYARAHTLNQSKFDLNDIEIIGTRSPGYRAPDNKPLDRRHIPLLSSAEVSEFMDQLRPTLQSPGNITGVQYMQIDDGLLERELAEEGTHLDRGGSPRIFQQYFGNREDVIYRLIDANGNARFDKVFDTVPFPVAKRVSGTADALKSRFGVQWPASSRLNGTEQDLPPGGK
jgi:hypothetical protein